MELVPVQLNNPPSGAANDVPALKASARHLAVTFMTEMLKASGLEKAMGASDGMAGSFSSSVLGLIAEDVVEGSPAFTESLFRQLEGIAGERQTDHAY